MTSFFGIAFEKFKQELHQNKTKLWFSWPFLELNKLVSSGKEFIVVVKTVCEDSLTLKSFFWMELSSRVGKFLGSGQRYYFLFCSERSLKVNLGFVFQTEFASFCRLGGNLAMPTIMVPVMPPFSRKH